MIKITPLSQARSMAWLKGRYNAKIREIETVELRLSHYVPGTFVHKKTAQELEILKLQARTIDEKRANKLKLLVDHVTEYQIPVVKHLIK